MKDWRKVWKSSVLYDYKTRLHKEDISRLSLMYPMQNYG